MSYLSLIEGIYQEKYIQIANLYIMKLDNYSNHLIYQMTKTGNQEQKYSWILNNFIFKDLSSLITDNINWPVLKSLQMFSFYYTKFLVNGVYSSQHFYILEMQKLLITILLDGIFEYSTTFNALADMRLNETRSIINIELIITASIFIIFSSIIISFYRGFDQFDDAIEQRFLSLSPFFIANNTCLTEYAVKMIEKDKVSKTITSYLDLFETCNISLLILSDKQTILGFTQPLQILFGYKYEQLIQQNIEIIFPKIQNNEELLYKRFNHYINHKVTPENDELNGVVLKGRCSDNSPISLNVFLRSVHENGNQYFVMEIHPITEEVSCLEIIKSHQELTKEFEKMALPVHLFPGIENSQYPITHEFKNCALVLIYSYLNDAVSGNIDYSEIGMHKSIKEMSANYLFNCRNSIILSSTHDSFIVLFFDETENELKYENENDTNDKTYNEIEKSSNRRHLDNTLNFINEYTHISNFSVSCVVLEDENIKVTINPSPSKNKNIQDQLKLRIPSMTIEPHTTKIKELVDISFLMIPNCILTTKDTVLKMGAMENAIPVNNDICQDLYHVRLF
ncbi:hypothetical protein TRFO_01496 [Tritrichomonas foetus]|uniref:PAS domain-containing protein n=1 Tax=Tritrichomonas foetus TaxID=1144522 RepID=A0A1J4JXC9_9EUKA|nr:hypothetical protein TRFO_01496 [Tritrichomonas foetus]|eukprot:OHT03809.1 hypothetical protein TRFO_01496 [Tritrichomonas foetus]